MLPVELMKQKETFPLGSSAAPRIGSVPYLNALPLVWGIEEAIRYEPPSRLAGLLRRRAIDAALVSVVEALFTGAYWVLDGVAIGSRGPVQSVILAHRKPLEQVEEIFCDTASLTSFNLLRTLLVQRGLRPRFRPLLDYRRARELDAVFLIGDQALRLAWEGTDHRIWDLGQAWHELTGLPFVYAVWAIRPEAATPELCRLLEKAGRAGRQRFKEAARRPGPCDAAFRETYLRRHVHYRLGPEEKRGLELFGEMLQRHGVRPVRPARFVSSESLVRAS